MSTAVTNFAASKKQKKEEKKKKKKEVINMPIPEHFAVKTREVPETPEDFEIEKVLKHKNVHHMAELISKVEFLLLTVTLFFPSMAIKNNLEMHFEPIQN